MRPGGGRAKGAAAERAVVNMLKRHGFVDAHRTAPMQAGHAEKYPDVGGVPGLWIEVKCYAQTPIWGFLKALQPTATGSRLPVIFWKDTRTQWYVSAHSRSFDFLVNLSDFRLVEIKPRELLNKACKEYLPTDYEHRIVRKWHYDTMLLESFLHIYNPTSEG